MANTISVSDVSSRLPTLRSVRTLRLTLGLTILCGAIVSFLGLTWDIQWHSLVGRDRTLIPPHIMILSGITLSGLSALLAVLIETNWTRSNPELSAVSVRFAERFYGTLGAYVAGFFALSAAIAFPLDSYWHALYGIDTHLWTPFHVMIISSMGLMALGAAYMLFSTARLASRAGENRSVWIAYGATIIAFATTLRILAQLWSDAITIHRFVTIWDITFLPFLLLAGVLMGWLLVAAATSLPWHGVASSVTLVYIGLLLLSSAFVPPAMSWLIAEEHLSYRRSAISLGLAGGHTVGASLTFQQPLAILLAALCVDVCVFLARRKGWSRNRLLTMLVGSTLLGVILMAVMRFGFSLQVQQVGIVGLLLTLVLGLLSAFIGAWFGQRMGLFMQQEEREA